MINFQLLNKATYILMVSLTFCYVNTNRKKIQISAS